MTKLNILLVTQHFKLVGGSDVVVQQTKRLLEQKGHEVFLFAAITEGDTQNDKESFPDGSHLASPKLNNAYKFFFSAEARKKLDKLLKDKLFDVAHLHIYYGTLTSSILQPLKKRGIKIVQHLHEYRTFCSIYTAHRNGKECSECTVGNYLPGLMNRCNRNSLLRSTASTVEMYISDFLGAKASPDMFVCVSEFQKEKLIAQGLCEDKIKVIYNPVAPMFFENRPLSLKLRHGVLFVGRVEAYKGIFELLLVAQALADIEFTIIGDGSAIDSVKRILIEKNITNVRLTGNIAREQILVEMRKNRIILVPSLWNETFGLTAIEGMAAGLIPIVSNVGGLPEVVGKNTNCGYVVDALKVNAIKSLVSKLVCDDKLCSDLARNAIARARDCFSEEIFLKNIEELYSHVKSL